MKIDTKRYGLSKSDLARVEALPDEPQWVAWDVQDGAELCVVHTGSPHGLFSCGWDGTHKLILLEMGNDEVPHPPYVYEKIMRVAEELAVAFNREFPDGLPEAPERDEDEDDED